MSKNLLFLISFNILIKITPEQIFQVDDDEKIFEFAHEKGMK